MIRTVLFTGDKFLNIDFKSENIFLPENYTVEKSGVWESTLNNVESQLEEQMINVCNQNGLLIDKIDVMLETDYENIEIKSIEISGADSQAAKNLIAGYFKIGLAYIIIDGV